MRVQQISQTPIYQKENRQNRSVSTLGSCKPKPKSNIGRGDFSMPSFKSRVKTKQAKTLMQEVGSLVEHTCNSIKESYDKSNIKKFIVAPASKLWGDFKSKIYSLNRKFDEKAPTFAPIAKGALITTGIVAAYDTLKQ